MEELEFNCAVITLSFNQSLNSCRLHSLSLSFQVILRIEMAK